MEVIILVGGLGTRLKSVIHDIPKPMAMVRNKPFLEYVLTWLSGYNITKIVLAAGYKVDIIKAHFKNQYKNIPIVYAIEHSPLGTGGGILNGLTHTSSQNVLIVNGDTFFPIDIKAFFSGHLKMEGKITIALKKMIDFDRYGSVEIDQNCNIIQFTEKKFQKHALINGGLYFLKSEFFKERIFPAKFSFEKDILEKEINTGILKGMEFKDDFLDIGIPEDYYKADQLL